MIQRSETGSGELDLSLIVPCYNEEAVAEFTISRLLEAFRNADVRLELIAVDNGSGDRTDEILARLAADEPEVRIVTVDENRGYGHGVLCGIPACRGRWIGVIPADGQVDAEDVARLFLAAVTTDGRVLAKVRRRFRMDGLIRKVVSVAYNLFFRALWPKIASLDINGSPKILPREYVERMDLESEDWLLDAEMMVKAHRLGLRVFEVNVFARMRGAGTSNVRAGTVFQFLTRLLGVRFFGLHGGWRCGRTTSGSERPDPEPAARPARDDPDPKPGGPARMTSERPGPEPAAR